MVNKIRRFIGKGTERISSILKKRKEYQEKRQTEKAEQRTELIVKLRAKAKHEIEIAKLQKQRFDAKRLAFESARKSREAKHHYIHGRTKAVLSAIPLGRSSAYPQTINKMVFGDMGGPFGGKSFERVGGKKKKTHDNYFGL